MKPIYIRLDTVFVWDQKEFCKLFLKVHCENKDFKLDIFLLGCPEATWG